MELDTSSELQTRQRRVTLKLVSSFLEVVNMYEWELSA
jgi:hypothetical protein